MHIGSLVGLLCKAQPKEMPTVIASPRNGHMGGVIFGYPAKDVKIRLATVTRHLGVVQNFLLECHAYHRVDQCRVVWVPNRSRSQPLWVSKRSIAGMQ